MALILGGILFDDMEIPPEINFSGAHALTVHKLIGGDRVVDAMGDDPDPIEWSGYFFGANASSRARSLDEMKKAGTPVLVLYGSFSYNVIIRDFKPKYQREYQLSYQIRLEVIPSSMGALATLTDLVASDFSSLASFTSLSASAVASISAAQAAVDTAKASISTGLLEDATIATIALAATAANASYGALDDDLAAQGSALPTANLDSILQTMGPGDVSQFISALEASGSMSDTALARGYMGRIASNLSLYPG